MGWNDYHRRRDIMDAVIRRARRSPGAPLSLADFDGASELFSSEEDLLLALQYRWTQVLGGRLRAIAGGPEDADGLPGGGETDHVDRVGKAWRTAASDNRGLRAVLDANVLAYPELRKMYEAEMRMLAVTAGLAEPGDSQEEVTRIGVAFVSLLKESTVRRAAPRRANPVGQWLRKLAPTG